MSKKKKRFAKRKRCKTRNHAYDKHHLCFQRRRWSRGYYVNKLRLFHYCIIYIPKDTLHHMIHEGIEEVPVPKEFNAQHALEQLQMLEHYEAIHDDDPIERRLMILAALFDCCDQPTADAFRHQIEIVNRFNNEPS